MYYQNEFPRKKYYSIELKHKICKEHIEQGVRINELVRKYDLSCHSLIHSWLRNLGYITDSSRRRSKSCYIGIENVNILPEKFTKEQLITSTDEQKEIAFLKKELEDSKILAEGYRRMIEIAEAELKISIRKKPNTK
jgi:transposase-like protein